MHIRILQTNEPSECSVLTFTAAADVMRHRRSHFESAALQLLLIRTADTLAGIHRNTGSLHSSGARARVCACVRACLLV